jgi:S1-C subfamily serine protease
LAGRAGIRSGHLIESVNRKPVDSIADFARLVDAASVEAGILLQVNTGRGTMFVVLREL